MIRIILVLLSFVFFTGCAFFNTFYNARKSYNAGVDALLRANKTQQEQVVATRTIDPAYYSFEPKIPAGEAKPFFDIAIEKSNKVVVLHPGSKWVEDAILLMGKAYYLRGIENDYFEAKNRFEVFIVRYPNSEKIDDAKLWYGKTLIKLGQFSQASEAFRQISSTADPDIQAQAQILLGDILVLDEDFQVASEYYVQAVSLAKKDMTQRMALYKAAYAFYEIQHYSDAAQYFNQLLKKDLSVSEAFELNFLKARAQKSAGLYPDAIKTLDKLLGDQRHKTRFDRAEFEIGDVLRIKGAYREAERQFEHVIDNYPNSKFRGDAFYFLGLMNDSAGGLKDTRYSPDPTKARKYYYLVRTKYPNALYAADAARRLSYYDRIDYLRGSLEIDMDFKDQLDSQILRVDVSVPESTKETSSENQPEVNTSRLPSEIEPDKKKEPSAKEEVLNVKLKNDELDKKVLSVQKEMRSAASIVAVDSLQVLLKQIKVRIADDYVGLAEYFFNELQNFDSSAAYYNKIISDFPGTPSEEIAFFGLARVYHVKQDLGYRSFYETAIKRFPGSPYAQIARKILGMDIQQDPIKTRFEEAQRLMNDQSRAREAFELFKSVSLNDTSALRWSALFAMGLLCENQLDQPADAFRYYNSLSAAMPGTIYASAVEKKINGYRKFYKITGDSIGFTIDTTYVKIRPSGNTQKPEPKEREDRERNPNRVITPQEPAPIDTTTIEMTDSEIENFTRFLESKDSSSVKNRQTLRDSLLNKRLKPEKRPNKKDIIKEEPDDN